MNIYIYSVVPGMIVEQCSDPEAEEHELRGRTDAGTDPWGSRPGLCRSEM